MFEKRTIIIKFKSNNKVLFRILDISFMVKFNLLFAEVKVYKSLVIVELVTITYTFCETAGPPACVHLLCAPEKYLINKNVKTCINKT